MIILNTFVLSKKHEFLTAFYLPEKLQAFIHCASVHDCEQLIKAWDGRTLGDNTKPLQVRFKGDDPNVSKKNAPQISNNFTF